MKTKIYLLSLFIAVSVVFSSCIGNEPSRSDMQKYQTELLRYYPYFSGDTCVFKNMEQELTFVIVPQKANTRIVVCGPMDKCELDKEVKVKGIWNKNGDNIGAYFIANVGHPRGTDKLWCEYTYRIFMDSKNEYSGYLQIECPIDELLSHFTDTLMLPLNELDDKPYDVEGAYLRFVKDHGMTDFSLDGTTIWHQVEK